jgi:hypothetical protein
VTEVLQHHRQGGERRRFRQHPTGATAFHRERAEGVVDPLGEGHAGELAVEDQGVHDLGHLDEPHGAQQLDHGEAVRAGGLDQRLRQGPHVLAELDDQADGSGVAQ